MPLTQSRAEAEISFDVEPGIVADAAQQVLKKLGRVKSVSRETGLIQGKIKPTRLSEKGQISINIGRVGDSTTVKVKLEVHVPILGPKNPAPQGVAKFMDALGSHPSLLGSSNSGW